MRMYPTGWSPQASPGARKHREPPAHHLRPAEPAGRSCHSMSIGRRTRMRPQRPRFLSLAAAASAAAVLAACSSGSSPSSNSASPSVAARYGFAMIEGAGGAPAVFDTPSNKARHNVFDVSYPIVAQYDPLVTWIKSLPAGQRPTTAAYPIIDNPFTIPPEWRAKRLLEGSGIKSLYAKVIPAEAPDYRAAANQ